MKRLKLSGRRIRILGGILCGAGLLLFAPPEWTRAQTHDHLDRHEAADRQVVYVSAWFADVKATSIKRADGSIDTVLQNDAGRILARSRHRNGVLEAEVPGLARTAKYTAPLDRNVPRRVGWFNDQLRVLWADHGEIERTPALMNQSQPTEVDRGFVRLKRQLARQKQLRTPDPADAEPEQMRTQFADSFAYTELELPPTRKKGHVYPKFTTRFYDAEGLEIGLMRWYDKPKALSWKFANGDAGTAPEWRIPGGYRFTPTMEWAGLQAHIFQNAHHHVPGDEAPQVAAAGVLGTLAAVADRALDVAINAAITPAFAQEEPSDPPPQCDGQSDGCTGLHFLDNTSFVACCDRHDLCFEADCSNVCTKRSWLFPWQNWHCAACNMAAVFCFVTGGAGEPPPDPDPPPTGSGCAAENDGNPCTRCSMADWCPAECQSCS